MVLGTSKRPNIGSFSGAFESRGKSRRALKVSFTQETLDMAEKREKDVKSSSPKKEKEVDKYRLGSGSSWRMETLNTLRVIYEPDEPQPLPDKVLRYMPKLGNGRSNEMGEQENIHDPEELKLEERIKVLRIRSLEVTGHLILHAEAKAFDELKLLNPLSRAFGLLRQLVTGKSEESVERTHARNSKNVQSRKELKRLKTEHTFTPIVDETIAQLDSSGTGGEIVVPGSAKSEIAQLDSSGTGGEIVGPGSAKSEMDSEPRTPIMPASLPEKRKASSGSTTSFGLKSTQTTPVKIIQGEPLVQSLISDLARGIFAAIYGSENVYLPWVKRKMCCLRFSPACKETLYFYYKKSGDERASQVICIPDGGMEIVVATKSGREQQWSKQAFCMLFEAKKLDTTYEALYGMEDEPVNDNYAAQIFGEMLSLVCHKEYIATGAQTAFLMNVVGVRGCFFWATFPPEYLKLLRFGNIEELEKVYKEKIITLHHTKRRNLISEDDRDEFIKEFISVIRCIADGESEIAFVRRDGDSPIHGSSDAASDYGDFGSDYGDFGSDYGDSPIHGSNAD